MKILITGIAGAIGSHLAERLLSMGHEVVGIDSLTTYYSPAIKKINAEDVISKGGKIHFKNLAKDSLVDVVDGVEVVFHFAAQPGISATTSFEDYVENNIIATHKLLESLKESKQLKLFFHASTSSVYGARAGGDETSEPKPTSNYGVTKLTSEQLAMSYWREIGLPVTVFRLFSVYGERERPDKFFHKLIRAICENNEISFYEGSEQHIRSYTYVQDIIDGCILALENIEKVVGEIFNLGTDITNTTGEGLRLVEEIMGKKARLKIIPPRAGDQIETSANITKARLVLGYSPKTTLKEGLRKQVEWYSKKLHGKI